MLLQLGAFGIKNNTISLVVDLVILFLVVMWLALVYWTYADARRRIADPLLVGCATAASLFPFVGTIVYMIVRPPEYLDDVRERELEMQAAEARLAELGYHLPAQAEGPLQGMRQAAGPGLEDLPVLRDRGRHDHRFASPRPTAP